MVVRKGEKPSSWLSTSIYVLRTSTFRHLPPCFMHRDTHWRTGRIAFISNRIDFNSIRFQATSPSSKWNSFGSFHLEHRDVNPNTWRIVFIFNRIDFNSIRLQAPFCVPHLFTDSTGSKRNSFGWFPIWILWIWFYEMLRCLSAYGLGFYSRW